MKRVKTGILLILSFLISISLGAQTSFERGEELFLQNRPQEALHFLENAIAEDSVHVQAFLYLGITYLQLNRVDDAISTYMQIFPRSGFEAPRVAYNLGNAYFTKGEHEAARQFYTQAIELDPRFSSAYLNRANANVRTGDLDDAIMDYEEYLRLDPGSSQREPILRLIAFIREERVAAERLRVMQEEAARAAEAAARAAEERERLAREAAARAAEEEARIAAERRRLLLEEVNQSLLSVAGDSQGLWAGTEDFHDFDNEFELD